MEKAGKSVTIYLDNNKKSFQVIRPTRAFNGDWKGLVEAVTKGHYHSFKVL